MCPRATAQHGGAAMGRASTTGVAAASAHSFGEEEYIDLDLSSCGEYEFRVCRSSKAAAAAAPCADELLCRGRLHKVAPRPSGKLLDPDAAAGGGGGGGRRSTATVAPLQQHPHAGGIRCAQPAAARVHAEGSRRKKPGKAAVHAKLQASRAFFRSLFARTSCSDEQCHRGVGVRSEGTGRTAAPCRTKSGKAAFGQIKSSCYSVSGSGSAAPTTLRSSIEQEKLMDEEEFAAASSSSRQRKSFSGVIKWRPATATATAAPSKNPAPAWSSTTRRRNSSGEHGPALKRSSSCRSESEGLIQGAIAYCKRSQQQRVLTRKSVSDAALCSFRPSS